MSIFGDQKVGSICLPEHGTGIFTMKMAVVSGKRGSKIGVVRNEIPNTKPKEGGDRKKKK
jgi:hypothetical protein